MIYEKDSNNSAGENNIGAPKMRNNFWYKIKGFTFLYCSKYSYHSSINLFAAFFVPVLCISSWLLFSIAPHIAIYKAIAESKGNHIAIAFLKSKKEQQLLLSIVIVASAITI